MTRPWRVQGRRVIGSIQTAIGPLGMEPAPFTLLVPVDGAVKDPGFDEKVFAEMLGAMGRLDREEFDIDDGTLAELRELFTGWRTDLNAPHRVARTSPIEAPTHVG